MSRIPGSIDSAVEPSEPIERTRLVDRLSAASACPITLLIAPAGYGKSVALRQYLGTLDRRSVCFSLRSEHATLLGFVRGFAEAFGEKAPHAIASLAEAYERNISSPNRGADLAQWMRAHLDSFAGVVGIDDLHVAEADPEVAQFLTSLIELTKGTVRWFLASRSTTAIWHSLHQKPARPRTGLDLYFATTSLPIFCGLRRVGRPQRASHCGLQCIRQIYATSPRPLGR